MTPGAVYVGQIHGPDVAAPFWTSWSRLLLHDAAHHQRLSRGGWAPAWTPSSRIPQGRNGLAKSCLASDAEALLMIDSDMAFEPDALDRLYDVLDPVERPIVGGLCFTHKIVSMDEGFNTPVAEVAPTTYAFKDDLFFSVDYPRDTVVRVAGTGGAFVLIHRTVLERIAEEYGPVWFNELATPPSASEAADRYSEDLSFMLRAGALGFPIHVHTGVRTKHAKVSYLDEERYLLDRWVAEAAPDATVAVIPAKDRLDLTKPLVKALHGQCAEIVIVDNGSSRDTLRWLEHQKYATVLDGSGCGIHEMWNQGARYALSQHRKVNLLFLNNDLEVGAGFVEGLRGALRAGDLAAVCPNYDGRAGSGVEQVQGIAADRSDGTGGLAGFAFMVRGEWFQQGYRFPEECRWWFGDNDLCMTLDAAGARYGVVLDVTVEHLGAGTAKDWTDPEWAEQITADQKAWMAKWGLVAAEVPA